MLPDIFMLFKKISYYSRGNEPDICVDRLLDSLLCELVLINRKNKASFLSSSLGSKLAIVKIGIEFTQLH